MKTLKERVKEKVPARYQDTPEFHIFLTIIEQEDLTTKSALRRYLNKEIRICEQELAQREGVTTFNRKRTRLAKKIDLLRTCHDKLLPYLK